MPLLPGKSKAAFGHNVAAEVNAGKPQKQAVTIAYSKAGEKHSKDKPGRKHKAKAGKAKGNPFPPKKAPASAAEAMDQGIAAAQPEY